MVATLSQGGQTKFEEGDEAIFDWATGRELESAGKVEVIETIYHRRLRDYARLFRTYTAELAGLDRSIELAQADLDKLAQSITDLQAQVAFQSNQRDQLEHDLNGLNREREVLVAYGQKLDTKWNELRESLSQLYRSNRQLVSQMAGN
jgi:chromosome segregation ATPase